MTLIKSEQKTEKVYFGDKSMENLWLETPASSALTSVDRFDEVQKILDNGINDGVICVFSEELSDNRLGELLAEMRDRGNRVYILANDFTDTMKNLDGCLIRYGGSRKIGSFILVNPTSNNPQGCLFTGRFSGGSLQLAGNFLLYLDNDQIPVLFRYFCQQFWKLAEKERIGPEAHDVDSAPVDIYPPHDNGCDFQYLQSVWKQEMNGALVTTSLSLNDSFLEFDNISNSTVVSLYSGIDEEIVRSLKQRNNTVIAIDDVCFVNSVKTGNTVWLVPKTDAAPGDEVYALSLNREEQPKILKDHIENLLKSKITYQFFASEKRKNLTGKTIVNLGRDLSEKYRINTETASDLGVQALSELPTQEEFENFKPVFNDDEKSVSILFKWTNKPFTLPDGSTKHTLYSNWDNTQNKIMAHIARIINIIDESEKKEKTLSNRILHFFLGKKQKFSEYRTDLDKLRGISYGSIEKVELQENIAQLNKILADVIKDADQITEENRKAGIQENIINKQKEKLALETGLSVKETEAANAKDDRQKLSDSFYTKGYIKRGDSLAEFSKELEKQLEMLKNEKKGELTRLEKLLADAKESAENGGDTTVKEIEKQIEEVNASKDSAVADIEQKLNETKETRNNLEELKLKHQRLENDADSFRKRISAKTREIELLEAQLKNTGGGKDEAQKKGSVLEGMKPGGKAASNRADSPQSLSVPELARLPAKGELYQHKGQDYLAIEYWEDYNEGKEEAGRLKAKLCAKGGK